MKIGIIGTGNMGGGLGRLWAARGHQVMFGSRNPESMKTMAGFNLNVNSGSIASAANFGTAVLLAVPWQGVEEAITKSGSLAGKIIIDCTNPLSEDYMQLLIGHSTSGAEEIAKLAPGAHVVKAFNTVASGVLSRPRFKDHTAAVFYCGDHRESKEEVAGLIRDIGFEAIDAGPLRNARYLEPVAELFIQLVYGQNMGGDMAFALLRRS